MVRLARGPLLFYGNNRIIGLFALSLYLYLYLYLSLYLRSRATSPLLGEKEKDPLHTVAEW
jgi:hypothetical protein